MPDNPNNFGNLSLRSGQSERHLLDLAQVKALSSSMKSQAFWSFNAYEPKSIADVAKLIGKTPQSMYGHVEKLVEVGLLLPAGTRQKRSRTEHLYVSIAPICRGILDGGKEYNRYRVRGFKLHTQNMVREYAHGSGALETDIAIGYLSQYRRYHLRISQDRARKLIMDMTQLMVEAMSEDIPEGTETYRFNAMAYVSLTLSELKIWAEANNIPFADLNRDSNAPMED